MPALTLLNQPDYLLPQVVDFLTKDWEAGLLDLSKTLVILPTQEARRRLHEALVREAGDRGAALLPPIWMLPMQLAEGGCSDIAPSSLEQFLWIDVIMGMKREEAQRLFPRNAPEFDPARASELSESIRRLRGELSQAGISLRDAEVRKPQDPRWKALISLEDQYLRRVEEAGYRDRIVTQITEAKKPVLPQGVKRLIVAGVPDLPKIYEAILPELEAQGLTVSILSFDPMGYGEHYFDSLGRPNEAWKEMPIPIEKQVIHLCLDRSEEAEKSALLALMSGGLGSSCAIGITTVELAQPIHDELKAIGIHAFNPAGQSLDNLPIGRLLKLLYNQLREDDFRSTLQLLRHADIQAWLNLDPARDLKTLDALANYLIPSSLGDLLARWPTEALSIEVSKTLRDSLSSLSLMISMLREGLGASPLFNSLRTIYQSRDLAQIAGGKESADRMRDWIAGCETVIATIRSSDLLMLLLSHLQSGIRMSEKQNGAVELPGWLELLWEDAAHLIIAGMNDGLVPECRQDDPFLHEKLRVEWGLSSDASRLRRDSYLLLCLMSARSGNQGRMDLLLARQDDEGVVLKPSRLLLRPTADSELPALVLELFREIPPRQSEKWRAAWSLKPDRLPAPLTLSASAIRDYLACPTRYYLKHLLKLAPEQFGAEEANASTFGKLLHDTLRDFGNDHRLRDFHKAEEIEGALVTIWKQLFETRFGSSPSFPLIYQREAGIRRLRSAAEVQAKLRSEGWEIVACERIFDAFPVGTTGISLGGQIDRIDRRVTANGTQWRIIDYKSSEGEKDPAKEHFRRLSKRDDPLRLAAYESFELNERTHLWIDLQLPIYRMILLSEFEQGTNFLSLGQTSAGPVEAGYFTLPAKINESAFISFTEIEQLEVSALACLTGLLQAIQQGIFWPPRQPKYDDFERLLFDHLEADAASGQQTLDATSLAQKLKL